jgi:membrane fusion protein (multidrug efflux system)
LDKKKKIIIVILTVILLVFIVIAGYMIKERIEYAITDAVFVKSNKLTKLSFKRVSGKIKKIYVEEGQRVKKGQVLAELDDKDYRLKLEQIEKEIDSLNAKLEALKIKRERVQKELNLSVDVSKLSIEEINKAIKSLKLKIASLNPQIEQLERDTKRLYDLATKGLAPRHKYEELETKLKILKLEKNSAEKKLEELYIKREILQKNFNITKTKLEQIKELDKSIKSLSSKISALEKQKEEIENLLNYTKLKACCDGVIAKRFHSEGEVVSTGIPIFALVPDNSLYILVLLEETKLEGIKEGAKAYITIDAYPDEKYEGIVYEINPTTASEFALVPRDITAGEFTKVAQRIPIKIKITKGNIKLLKVGLSGEVKIKRAK